MRYVLPSGSFHGSMQILPFRSLQGELVAIGIGLTSREKSRKSVGAPGDRGEGSAEIRGPLFWGD